MIIKSIWLRKIHKWVGVFVGLQFLMWTISGAAMALLSMNEVSGGAMADHAEAAPLPATSGWAHIKRQLGDRPILAVTLQELTGRQAIQISTDRGIRLFDAESGEAISIDRSSAVAIAKAAHPRGSSPSRAAQMKELTLAVREHELPIWRVDFADEGHSSYYVSGTTGAVLERRNDSWRWWDFFWMLHNMDYAKRTSFNHPLIIMAGFAMVWLAITGFWLLFRTMWRHDFTWLERVRLGGQPRRSTR